MSHRTSLTAFSHRSSVFHPYTRSRYPPRRFPIQWPSPSDLTLVLLGTVLIVACGGGSGSEGASGSGTGSPPILVAGPSSRVVPLGSSWIFTVTAVGENLAYQWRKGGQALPGKTGSSFIFTPVSPQDGGSLDVVVSNAAGQVTSTAVEARVVSAQGPWTHDLKLCSGPDPDNWGPPQAFLAQAGVPSLARRNSNQLVAVFQWFPFEDPSSFDLVAASFSSDGGRTWPVPKALTFTGLPEGYQRPFDPTVTVAEDGSLRLFFTSSLQGPSPANGFYSARSIDGLTYTFEPGTRFYPGRATVDCAVLRWNGQWHLIAPVGAPQEGAYHAVSIDGLTFTRMDDIPSVGGANWTGNLVAVGSALRFYGSPGQVLWYAETADGLAWSVPVRMGMVGGDPAVVEAEPGRWLMVYTAP
jgi:hypothetical protein